MVARTLLVVAAAMVASTAASPIALAEPVSTSLTPADEAVSLAPVSRAVDNPLLQARGGPCEQGSCPDLDKPFDLVYTFAAVPVPGGPGDPPLTIFESSSDIRVSDCGQCLRHRVATNLGNSVPGGCYSFNTCGRDQEICVDPGNYRAHRIYKDNGHKACYNLEVQNLGSCGPVKERIIVYPVGERACNY